MRVWLPLVGSGFSEDEAPSRAVSSSLGECLPVVRSTCSERILPEETCQQKPSKAQKHLYRRSADKGWRLSSYVGFLT